MSDEKDLMDLKIEETIETEKSAKEMDKMIADSSSYFQGQIDASKDWADKQTDLQQDRYDLTVKQINQNKDQAQKDLVKETSGAYVDYQKQINPYGANAEQMASTGLDNSGYSESSKVSMYNTYQNRVVAARESYNRAIMNYDNAIAEARLQNSSILAEIAYEALRTQLQLSLEGFQYKNTLVLQKAAERREIKSMYHAKYMDILNQINTEKALAEQKRQFDAQMAEEKRQFNILHSGSSGTTSKSSSGSGSSKGAKVDKNGNVKVGNDAVIDTMIGDINTYDEAVKYINAKGLSNKGQPLLTSAAWYKAKETGELGSELEYFNSYTDYVVAYIIWLES